MGGQLTPLPPWFQQPCNLNEVIVIDPRNSEEKHDKKEENKLVNRHSVFSQSEARLLNPKNSSNNEIIELLDENKENETLIYKSRSISKTVIDIYKESKEKNNPNICENCDGSFKSKYFMKRRLCTPCTLSKFMEKKKGEYFNQKCLDMFELNAEPAEQI